jgi:hydrogenase-4 component J
MAGRVVFYQLTHKFVNREQDIPEDSRQVIYYSLAIAITWV